MSAKRAAEKVCSVVLTICIAIHIATSDQDAPSTAPPLQCHGPVPRFSRGEYYFHDNDSYDLRITTDVQLSMNLNQMSCFQVDIEPQRNSTVDTVISTLFYAIQYEQFMQHYPVTRRYQFGVPEFQSYCKCDCPQADAFCTHAFAWKTCSKGEICVTKFTPYQNSYGCQHEGPASLCCEVTVKPFENRRFTAVFLGVAVPEAVLSIRIFVLHDAQWTLFRHYVRSIVPFRGNFLHLNGYENTADMVILAQTVQSPFSLDGDSYYFEESTNPKLLQGPLNDLHAYDTNKFGWFRFVDSQWRIRDLETLHEIHNPQVTNCKLQTYIDRFSVNSDIKVIRNSTGALNAEPFIGYDLLDMHKNYLTALSVQQYRDSDLSVTAWHTTNSAPTLKLDIALQQKMHVVAHVHASFLDGFLAKICLDKHMNQFLNVTLLLAYGHFTIEIFKDGVSNAVDLVTSLNTDVPFAKNYTEILPLPAHIVSARFICVRPVRKKNGGSCKWAEFIKEPILSFELKAPFIATEGSCPGCNYETETSFWAGLNPKNWLNGIGSPWEGLALFIECIVYFLLALIIIGLCRKFLRPLLQWAICRSRQTGVKNCDSCGQI